MIFLDLLFPKTCLSCGKWGQYICNTCRLQFVPIKKDACLYCDKITDFGIIHKSCLRPQEIDGYIGLWYLTPPLQKVIKKIKYKLITDAFRELCYSSSLSRQKVIQDFGIKFKNSFIQPIPLHIDRRTLRGFNQSDLIAKFLQEGSGLIKVDLLKRVRNTLPQAQTVSKLERYQNMKEAFSTKDPYCFNNKTVILVDDIYTTGNTVRQAARACKSAGADKVFVFTFAKG